MIRVEGYKNLYRDEKSGAIINCDTTSYNQYVNSLSYKELQKQEIKLSETLTEQELNFAIVPSEIGKMFYKIQIAGFEEEANLINNEKEFVLNVLKSKLKIFLLSNSPNYNTRFLLASLKSEIFEVNSIIAFQNSQFQIITDQGKRDFMHKKRH